jgi:endonuclease/exonuclease/phosphatase family metal-dependent hydrolase
VLAAAVALTALGAGAGVTAGAAPAAAGAGEDGTVVPAGVTMVQANIYTGLTVDRFQADVRRVLAQHPDFITYNEVMFRKDPVLAPAGYAIYRSTKNRFTAETPVAWRADRWTAIDHGTTMISDWRGKPPGRVVEIGRRFANWVTLQGVDGRVVSVVTVHTAPVDRNMPDLIRPSVNRLGALVDSLAPAGPVLVGGDFNVHYRSGRYPRDILAAHALVPTYDALGSYFPTGDHEGATIDYVLKRDDRGDLAATSQRPVELNSDHDAVVADYTWQTDAPASTRTITSDPAGDVGTQRVALRSLAQVVRSAQRGATVEVATRSLDAVAVARPLKRALARGVHVEIVTASRTLTLREQRLQRTLAARGDAQSWLRRCSGACLDAWRSAGVPAALVMVSDPKGSWQTRAQANRALTWTMVEAPTKVTISTGPDALAEGAGLFDAVS